MALFGEDLSVVNVGLGGFAAPIAAACASVVDVAWSPPAAGDEAAARALARLVVSEQVATANAEAFARYLAARPVLEGIGIAGEVIPGMGARTILHAGPPVAWDAMCGPMRGGVIAAILLEGWAGDAATAEALAASGEVTFDSCHHHAAVGPMAGIVCPSMPVWIVANAEHGNRSYCTLNEGLGRVLRFGAYDAEVLDRLRWMADVLAPVLAAALDVLGEVELKPLMAQALHMGDEVHNRNVAATSLFIRRVLPAALATRHDPADIAEVVRFVAGNDHFFLNLSMAACKAMLDAAHGVAGASMVTAMARNGVEFGIRVSGLGERWFTAPAPVIDGLFFAGYRADDANPDLGDSTITETAGIGGFAMAAAPAIVQFVGGTPADAVANTREMAHITLGRNGAFTLPQIDFAGTPAGIDARKAVDTGIAPVINTGIAHRDAGVGQVGAGITRAPLACFAQAVAALADALEA
jgi:hypothetical protein